MKIDVESFVAQLTQLLQLQEEEKYNEAYKLAGELVSQHPYSSDLWVKQGILIQLLGDEPSTEDVTLESARMRFQMALTIQPEAFEPNLELGYFEYSVQDDLSQGRKYFERAEAIANSALREACIGKIKCLIELGEYELAQKDLERGLAHFIQDPDLGQLRVVLEAARSGPG